MLKREKSVKKVYQRKPLPVLEPTPEPEPLLIIEPTPEPEPLLTIEPAPIEIPEIVHVITPVESTQAPDLHLELALLQRRLDDYMKLMNERFDKLATLFQ